MKNTKPNFNFLFYFFIISILFLNLTIAVTPNQMQINFDIYSGEEVCKVISVSSNKEIQAIIQDIWTANYENGNLREYTTDPSEHGLEIKYNPNLDFSKASSIDVEICIKANKIGKFRGALVFAPQNQTGNVIQYSTWLKVTVTEKPQPQEPENNNNKPNPKTSSGNPIPTTTTPPSINTQTNQTTQQPQEEQETQHPQEPQEQETQQPKQPQEQQEPKLLITGNVIGFIEKNYYIGIIFLAIFLIAFLLIYIKKQKTKKNE